MATALELTYLETRNRLKEQIRKEMSKEIDSTLSGYNDSSKEKILFDKTSTYGSFFGPSLPTIAERVIQESNNLPLGSGKVSAFRLVNSNTNDSGSSTNKASSKKGEKSARKLRKVTVDQWMKAKRLRETRDYSFLFSDDTIVAQQPIPAAKLPFPLVKKDSVSNNMKELQEPVDSRLIPKKVPVHSVRKDSVSNNTKGLKKHPAAGLLKSHTKRSAHNQINGKGLQEFNDGKLKPKQPVAVSSTPSKKRQHDEQMNKKESRESINGAKLKPRQTAVASLKPQTNKRGSENVYSRVALQDHSPKKTKELGVNNSKVLQKPNEAKSNLVPKQPVALSKHQTNKRAHEQISSQVSSHNERPKKRRLVRSKQLSDQEEDDYEAEKALFFIRKMFNTKRFVDRDDSDTNMEASFADILKEEKRSERLARKEDQEQLRLLEEEEKHERMRKLAKKGNQGTKNCK